MHRKVKDVLFEMRLDFAEKENKEYPKKKLDPNFEAAVQGKMITGCLLEMVRDDAFLSSAGVLNIRQLIGIMAWGKTMTHADCLFKCVGIASYLNSFVGYQKFE